MKTANFELEIFEQNSNGNDRVHPRVHIIWKVPIGAGTASNSGVPVVICTQLEIAQRRLDGMRDRAKVEEEPFKYFMETCPLDHLFGASMTGIVDEYDSFVRQLMKENGSITRHHEQALDEIRKSCREALAVKDLEIAELRAELA